MKNKDKFRSEDQGLKEKIRSMKNHIRKIERENNRLKSEIKTLEAGFKSSLTYIDQELKSFDVLDIVEYFAKKTKTKKSERTDNTLTELKDKWVCHQCSKGIIKLIKVPRPDGVWYFRKCNECTNRTEMKPYNDAIEVS